MAQYVRTPQDVGDALAIPDPRHAEMMAALDRTLRARQIAASGGGGGGAPRVLPGPGTTYKAMTGGPAARLAGIGHQGPPPGTLGSGSGHHIQGGQQGFPEWFQKAMFNRQWEEQKLGAQQSMEGQKLQVQLAKLLGMQQDASLGRQARASEGALDRQASQRRADTTQQTELQRIQAMLSGQQAPNLLAVLKKQMYGDEKRDKQAQAQADQESQIRQLIMKHSASIMGSGHIPNELAYKIAVLKQQPDQTAFKSIQKQILGLLDPTRDHWDFAYPGWSDEDIRKWNRDRASGSLR